MLDGATTGFLLGAATSAYQIEGGNHNDWTAWEKGRYPDGQPHVLDGASAARADDSWNLWRSDIAALGLRAMTAGAISCWMAAAIAGLFIE
jgi:beta-glucosidase/6-phospho-beta-glucosidase/beta-galactosidase